MYPVAGEPGRDVQAARGRATQRARRRPHPRRPTGILLPGAFPPKAWISRQQTHCSTIRRASQAPDALPWKGASRPRFRSRASVRPAGTGKTPCVPREAAVSVAFPIPPRITFRSIDSGRPALHGGALSLPPPRFLEGPCLVLVPRPRRRRRALPEKERRAESQSGRNAAETRQKRGRIGAESDRVRVRAMKGHGRHAPQTTGDSDIDPLASSPLRGCRGQRAAGCGAAGRRFTSGYYYRGALYICTGYESTEERTEVRRVPNGERWCSSHS